MNILYKDQLSEITQMGACNVWHVQNYPKGQRQDFLQLAVVMFRCIIGGGGRSYREQLRFIEWRGQVPSGHSTANPTLPVATPPYTCSIFKSTIVPHLQNNVVITFIYRPERIQIHFLGREAFAIVFIIILIPLVYIF